MVALRLLLLLDLLLDLEFLSDLELLLPTLLDVDFLSSSSNDENHLNIADGSTLSEDDIALGGVSLLLLVLDILLDLEFLLDLELLPTLLDVDFLSSSNDENHVNIADGCTLSEDDIALCRGSLLLVGVVGAMSRWLLL